MKAVTAAILMASGYFAMMIGVPIFDSRVMSSFGLMLVVVTGAAVIKQSEVR